MTTVNWSIVDDNLSWLSLTHFEPSLVYPDLSKDRDFVQEDKNNYLRCPAIVDFFKNTYVIKSPIDMTFNFDSKTNWIQIADKPQEFYNSFVLNRCSVRASEKTPMLMTLRLFYLFVSDKPCRIEMFQPFMSLDSCVQQIRILPGSFDISKWFRQLEIVFEIVDSKKPLVIKRGDTLCYVRFTPQNNEKITLNQKPFTQEMRKEITKCNTVKDALPGLPLKSLYEFAKKINKKVFGFNR